MAIGAQRLDEVHDVGTGADQLQSVKQELMQDTRERRLEVEEDEGRAIPSEYIVEQEPIS